MMHNLLKDVFAVLTADQKQRFYKLQVLVIFMALAEVGGVAMIGYFMVLIADYQTIETHSYFTFVSGILGTGKIPTLITIASTILMVLFLTSLVSMYTTWRSAKFCFSIGEEMSNRLFKLYLHKDWLFFSQTSSSDMVSSIAGDITRVSQSIIQPLLNLNSKLFLTICLSTLVFVIDPWVAIGAVLYFSVCYSILYRFVKKHLHQNGSTVTRENSTRFRILREGFGGIKDIILLSKQDFLSQQFEASNHEYSESLANNTALGLAPRYFMEFLALGSVVALVIALTLQSQGEITDILPVLSIYGVAGLKMLPAFQQSYQNIALIKGSAGSFYNVHESLTAGIALEEKRTTQTQRVQFDKSISINDLSFAYDDGKKVLKNISLEIGKGQSVAFVGPSGSGKSTLIDILCGLIPNYQGTIHVDNTDLSTIDATVWKKMLGVVSQSVYLSESTIESNIAFGIDTQNIDQNRLKNAIVQANLSELVNSLPNKERTEVGELGTMLSGGQRQRVGIARALYNDAELLIMDEATSALDNIAEESIMKSIDSLSNKKTVIMIAHRLSTIKNCDTIFLMSEGEIVSKGTYDELLKNNRLFQEMANAK